MTDMSHLDSKYFIDSYKYNCPYCNRRHVAYVITNDFVFDWSKDKTCHIYLAKCLSCQNTSAHFTYDYLDITYSQHVDGDRCYRFDEAKIDTSIELDERFFLSLPTSFFTLDDSIPKKLRELFAEAEGCLKGNFLTGCSACVRKLIYELAVLLKAEGGNYDERLKSLKVVRSDIDPTYFDTLLTVQQMTSSKVHEQSYDNWQSKHLRIILAAVKEILNEVYVEPNLRNKRRSEILKLKSDLLPPNS